MKRIEKFESQKKIVQEIQAIVAESTLTYMEATILYAERNNLEIEFVAEMIVKNDVIRSKIEEEAEELNFIKKKTRLPI